MFVLDITRHLNFFSAACVAALFLISNLSPFFDPDMKLFGVMALILIFVGSLAGGIVSIMLPSVSSSVVSAALLGLLLSSFFSVVGLDLSKTVVILLFLASFGIFAVASIQFQKSIPTIQNSSVFGLAVALSIDSCFDNSLWNLILSILRFQDLASHSTTYLKSSIVLWIVCTIVPSLLAVCKNAYNWNNFYSINVAGAAIPLSATNKAAEEMTSTSFKQRTFSYPDTLISNYVDPDDIPELIKPYAETIFTSAQNIMQYHGFQVDNSRNQSEHLIMLLFNETSPSDKMVSSPALRIHSRMFKNYMKWCGSLSISPLLLKNISVVKSHDLIIEDMLLYLLIWGEAANLRHLPECLCFLFHKTMEEHIYQKGSFGTTNGKYPGFYLDMVITPIYEIISKSVSNVVDHAERKIYDDFNEFFWSVDCLKYSLRLRPTRPVEDEIDANNERDLANALKKASKTYLEKRSWFHPIFAMNRIFEWHVVTFTILATAAFSNLLQWNNVFTLQVGSFIFWEIIFLQILWTFLEIWTIYPDVIVTDTTSCGFLIRVLTEFTVLTYQTIYYHWTFADRSNEFLKDAPNFSNGDEMYWWWQYIWISVIALSVYFAQNIFCWFPNLSSILLSSKNEVFQSFLSIVYPFSQLFVGKTAGVKQQEVNQYIFFWVTLLSFKLWFGYQYVVSPVATPTLELYDDYMNFEKISFVKTATLMFFWWLPHFLVYIIDLSIWYAVWSSIAGGFIAITDRLGAVRDSQTFRSHFMRAPKLFNKHFMPSESSDAKDSLPSHLSTISLSEIVLHPKNEKELNRVNHSSYQNLEPMESGRSQELESKNREWTIFGRIWNEVVEKLRERDHISNREKELLLFSNFEWLSKPIYLPLYQTAGCVEMIVVAFRDAAAEYRTEQSKHLKMRIVENFYSSISATASEALQEAWELFSWITTELLGGIHFEDCSTIILKLNEWWKSGDIFVKLAAGSAKKLLDCANQITSELRKVVNKRKVAPLVPADTYAAAPSQELVNSVSKPSDGNIKKSISTGFLTALEDPNNSFTKLQPFRKGAELVDNARDKIRESLKNLLTELRVSLKGCSASDSQMESLCSKIVSTPSGFFLHDIYASKNIDLFCKDGRGSKAVTKLYDLLNLRITEVELKSYEANRRLNFLLNSLYMDVPKIPSCRYCKEYTCITPYYSEDILLTKSDLLTINSDNVSVLLYLQTLYKNDWANFLERRSIDESQIWTSAHMQELRMWASCRAQTLFRTVEGMMHSEYAIRLLAELEQLSSSEIDLLSKFKFNYVVACQVYGVFKKNQDPKADDIEFLLARYPNLRVAYIDACRINNVTETAFYSVLIKSDPVLKECKTPDPNNLEFRRDPIREVFRVKLPGNPVLGEGKPENQNHAIIFTRGRYLQAIDMNQDGYFEDALKMRNVLEEFNDGCVIVGFREHIFTGSVSSVANYMALQELSFVTLGQRVLYRPLKIRQHYGHPDLFDKLFVMTEGGMSKASRGINLSEDVFAGFNATIRGHSVKFVEYVQVGKGRDVGLQQTYKFEAKLAQGNAEQSLSRDMSRLGNRLDFFRLLSFYFGGLGHYLSNALVMFTLVIIVYTMLGLALYHEEGVNGRPLHPEGVFQLLLAGMGILQTLPLAVTLTVEKGFRRAISEISFMILSGGPLYFIFHIQTKCYYFSQTLLAGGAKYRPTGRGFVTRHSPFEENFRFFASSHIYLGFELIVALVLFGFYTTSKQYAGLTWSLWLAAVSFVMGPFWFNPLSFEWSRIQDDYLSWIKWMKEIGGDSEQSWDSWWRDENDFYRKLSITWKLFLLIQKCCLWIFIAVGIAGRDFFTSADEQTKVFQVIITVVVFFVGRELLGRFERDWTYATRRFTSLLLSSAVTSFLVYLFIMHQKHFLYSIALYYFMSATSFLMMLSGHYNYVIKLYKFHDYVVGHFLFFILSVASILQIGYLQTWLLYHNALSRGVEIDDILKFARKTKERAQSENDVITELKQKVAAQEKKILELSEYKDKLATIDKPFSNMQTSYGAVNSEKSSLTSGSTFPILAGGQMPRDEEFKFSQPTSFPQR